MHVEGISDLETCSTLKRVITTASESINGTVGVYALHVDKGPFISVRGEETFPLASTYKVPIAIGYLRRLEREGLNLDERIEVTTNDVPESSAILDPRHFSFPGISLSIRNIFRLMIEYSDNTAADLILKFAGGPSEIMRFMSEYGVTDIRVDRSTSQIFFF